jgi:hypothetical protein
MLATRFPFCREEGVGVLETGFVSCEIVLLHLKAIFTLVCLKRMVIFLMCGEVYMKVAHFVSFPVVVGSFGWVILCCILCFCLISRFLGKIVVLCDLQYDFPFFLLLLLLKWESEHSFDEESVGC